MSRARILRHALTTQPQPSGARSAFVLPCRKLVIEYCESQVGSKGTRDYLLQHAANMARTYSGVEFVVTPRPQRQPLARSFYLNGRSKQVSLQNLEATQVAPKIQQLLDSSGTKTDGLKRNPVRSTASSARGIWSPLHDDPHTL
ncbi:39S ribosomal protein L51, mitochondrial [Malassezia vespertilionis]|nr:39S ribosomal protein L51, mitochondrial [Malassezia vespertilionis]WFD06219.1 39S ribosomal protein L51, mitochondrial [Malassezia vespertilionis]